MVMDVGQELEVGDVIWDVGGKPLIPMETISSANQGALNGLTTAGQISSPVNREGSPIEASGEL